MKKFAPFFKGSRQSRRNAFSRAANVIAAIKISRGSITFLL
jgi:hypothetical protein